MKKDIMDAEINTKIKELLTTIIKRNVSPEIHAWLLDKAVQSSDKNSNYHLNLSFTSIPRKTGKKEIVLEDTDTKKFNDLLTGFSIQHWTIDRLCRVWLLMQLDTSDKENYISRIENLFPSAEMNEQVALYSALPLLAYPEAWKLQCAVGIRSNMGNVLEAIMYHNPYPAAYLEESAWNQLIMKAFFTGKNVNNIIGIDKRANQNLANMLFDYVEERWSAHRTEDLQIWRLTGRFLDEIHFYMMERLFREGDEREQQAAALTCADSSLERAKLLLDQYPQYKSAIDQNTLSWEVVANIE